MLAAVDVVSGYDGRTVLQGLTLPVARGKTTVLMGPSGVGKTTCIRHLTGLQMPWSGQILFEGRDMAYMSDDDLRACQQRMSVMLQGAGRLYGSGLFGSMSAFDNVAAPLRMRGEWGEREIAERASAGLEQVGLAGRADAMPADLSAGMLQRLALARALVSGSEVVVIDSVESGLDDVRLGVLAQIIRSAQQDTGATFLLATHHVALAHELGDVLAVLRAGRIEALGAPDDVLRDRDGFAARFVDGDPASGLTMADELDGPEPPAAPKAPSDRKVAALAIALTVTMAAILLTLVVSAIVLNEPTLPPGP